MLFRSYRKRKALESYRHVLGARLRGTFGRREHYAPDEVATTARAYGLSDAFLCYALAMYCEREPFEAWHAERGENCSYDRLWHELNAWVGGADTGLRLRDDGREPDAEAVADVGESLAAATDTDAGGGWFDGGGFDGGGFDGGGGD